MSLPPTNGTASGREAKQRPWLDLGPLLVFFVANWRFGIYVATGALIVAAALAMLVSWRLDGRVSPMMLFTTIAVLVFGGLTIALRDQRFIQIKLTVVYALLGGVLLGGLAAKRAFLKPLLGQAFALTDEGWRRLTLRFALFFLFLAVLNEVLRRRVSLDTWVSFKVFGVLGLTLVFTLLQARLIQRHTRASEER